MKSGIYLAGVIFLALYLTFLVKKLNVSPHRIQLLTPSPAALFLMFCNLSTSRLDFIHLHIQYTVLYFIICLSIAVKSVVRNHKRVLYLKYFHICI